MTWAFMTWYGVGYIVEVEGRMDAKQYVDILEETNTLGIRFAEEIPLPEFPFHYVSHTNSPMTHETSPSPDQNGPEKGTRNIGMARTQIGKRSTILFRIWKLLSKVHTTLF